MPRLLPPVRVMRSALPLSPLTSPEIVRRFEHAELKRLTVSPPTRTMWMRAYEESETLRAALLARLGVA